MTYILRDRPDGQVEIIVTRPTLIGVFPEREVAQCVRTFLQEEEINWPEDQPANFAVASDDVSEAMSEDLEALAEDISPAPADARVAGVRNLPALTPSRPTPPAFLAAGTKALSEDQRDAAFRRLIEGEKITAVAPDFGLSTFQLQGMWGAHRKQLQRHIAEGGQIACRHCRRPFTSSITNPDTCARCSHE